ncbi:MAG: shikimate dehydrogenase [Burkholderiales bacterium]|nr:shikimate dehydrogenase [Burkholderiales bacterium]
MTDRYAVIGNPVAHSLSPAIHAEFARQTGQDIAYTKLHAELGEFAAAVRQFQAGGGKGLNVTVPFKREACELATRVSGRAQRAGAVNTLVFAGEGIAGDNTDGVGLVRDLQTNLGFEMGGRRVLILGAGGAARGIVAPLLEAGPAQLAIANRTFETAKKLCGEFSPEVMIDAGSPTGNSTQPRLTAHRLEALPTEGFDLVINATSSSLTGADLGLIESVFAPDALAYDLMYGKGLTPFLGFAQHHGARVADGLGMLVEQAAESFFIWRGVRPETQSVIAAIGGRARFAFGRPGYTSGRS